MGKDNAIDLRANSLSLRLIRPDCGLTKPLYTVTGRGRVLLAGVTLNDIEMSMRDGRLEAALREAQH
jgi:hypothetical protein